MEPSSKSPAERARKSVALVLQRMKDPGSGTAVATSMGVSESTVSRIKNERLEEVMIFLAHLGLKVVPAEYKCVDRSTYEFLTTTHQRIMQTQPQLVWGDEDE